MEVHTNKACKFLFGCFKLTNGKIHLQRQSWGFTSHSIAKVILGQVFSIAICGGRTQKKETDCD